MAQILAYLHEAGAAVLPAAGAASLVFMLMARRTAKAPAGAARWASRAIVVFTVTGFGLEPLSGVVLAKALDRPLTEGWIVISVMLYILAAALWLPAAWVQSRLARLAVEAAAADRPPAAEYRRLYVVWFALALPALAVMAAITWLMMARPSIVLW